MSQPRGTHHCTPGGDEARFGCPQATLIPACKESTYFLQELRGKTANTERGLLEETRCWVGMGSRQEGWEALEEKVEGWGRVDGKGLARGTS